MQNQFVSSHSPGPSRPVCYTGGSYRCFNHRHGCRPSTAVQGGWQPLAFFSRKLSPAQQKYSAYDWELLAIYKAVKYFRHMLEARNFTVLTDHKPLTHLRLPPEEGQVFDSPIQPFGLHLTIYNRHPPHQRPGERRCDALPRVKAITAPVTRHTRRSTGSR